MANIDPGNHFGEEMNRSQNLSRVNSAWFDMREKQKIDEEMLKSKEDKGEFLKVVDDIKKKRKGKAVTLESKVSGANIKEWRDQKFTKLAFFKQMQKNFIRREDIPTVYGNTLNPDDDFQKRFFAGWDDITIDNNIYSLDRNKADYDKLGDVVEAAYLKNGLTDDEARERLLHHGPNKLPEKEKVPEIVKFLREITNTFALLMWAACALSFLGYGLAPSDLSNLYLAIVLALIVLVTGTFSYVQNKKSDAIMNAFKSGQITFVDVVRNGNPNTKINVFDLVVGDVVNIRNGEKTPADIRVFQGSGVKVDNSPLNGETKPVSISSEPGEKGIQDAMEATNMMFYSTLIKEGSGLGIVIRTGPNTFMGKIADLTSSAGDEITSLQREINDFIHLIAIVAISIGVVFFILGFIINYPIITNFLFCIGIIVANVPEGLITTVTICLVITAKKMKKKNVLVKNLQSVETLGSITCICSDKTGTLTQNKMKVVHLFYDCKIYKTESHFKDIEVDGNIVCKEVFDAQKPGFKYLQMNAICGLEDEFQRDISDDWDEFRNKLNMEIEANKNKADYNEDKIRSKLKQEMAEEFKNFYKTKPEERTSVKKNASELGIMKFFDSVEDIEKTKENFPSLEKHKIPFSSVYKYSCLLRKKNINTKPFDDGNYYYAAVKGAPDLLIKRCTRYMKDGKEYKIDKDFMDNFWLANRTFALKGERVLGFALFRCNPIDYPENFEFKIWFDKIVKPGSDVEETVPKANIPLDDLCFVGLVGMEDPPRPGVKEAVAICKKAGIKVIMVTGDQTLTAASIAEQIGIIDDLNNTPELIKHKFKDMTLEEAEKVSNTIIIDGTRLNAQLKSEEGLSDDNPQKGAALRSWLLKRDVIFARTSPEQKYIIVDGCQKLSHVVAVTGDGVNDSPAIKKADIGIAMGKVGTDVAKDAADILLLDDNFPNIIKGIKQGRLIFDILKKIIGYNLTSNVTELLPFLGFVILQFPLPLTTILVLCVDVGTNVYPNISFSYEIGEESLMERQPRNMKKDRLCNSRLFTWAYVFMGLYTTGGAFLIFWVILNDYGFRPGNLFFYINNYGIEPAASDVYNPYDAEFKGNSRAFIAKNADLLGIYGEANELLINSKYRQLDTSSNADVAIDNRLFFYTKPPSFWGQCKWDSVGKSYDGPVCYRLEALRHAQGGYLLGICIMQIANGTNYRTIQQSMFKHLLKNNSLNMAYFVLLGLISMLLYIPGLNDGFNIRPLRIEHWVPALGMFIIMISWAEFNKYLMRNVREPDGSPGFFSRQFNF